MGRRMEMQGDPLDLPGMGAGEEPVGRRGPTLLDWAHFGLSAVRRRTRLAVGVFLAGLVACAIYYKVKTPVYRVEARILAQRQQALPGIVRPTGAEDAPTRSAYDLVHRRENLLALVKQAGILSGEGTPGAKEGRLDKLRKSAATGKASSPDDDPVDELILLLDRELLVTSSEGAINISVDWPYPEEAFKLVEAAVQNFLEARHVQEITTRDEAISLLQGRVASLREHLDRASEESRRQGRRYDAAVDARSATPNFPMSEELVRVKSLMDAKERAIGDVEEFRRRRLADLLAQLDLQRGILSDAHPTIQNLRQDIAALSQDSPQVVALREEQRRLREEYSARVNLESGRAAGAPVAALPRPLAPGGNEETERVRQARFEYQQMVDRTNSALLDLDNARAGFKYRYDVIWPAQVPKTPVSPKPLKVFGLGFLASLMLAVAAAAGSLLRDGRIIQEWQIERTLQLPVLGRVTRS